MRKFPGMVGGLKARQLMLSSGGEVTSTSCRTNQEHTHNKERHQTINHVLSQLDMSLDLLLLAGLN